MTSNSKTGKKTMAEKKILSKKEIGRVLELLEQTYPDAGCALHYGTPFQLLVAVVLSAQTTDKKVNQVTGDLFRLYPTAEKMAQIPESELQERIKIIGMYRQKSKRHSAQPHTRREIRRRSA